MNNDSQGRPKRFEGSFLLLFLLLGGTLAVLCREGFKPYEVFWANDLPLGASAGAANKLPGAIFNCWVDYFWLGGDGIASLNFSNLCQGLFTPLIHFKFYAPATMFFLGFGAWFFFRQLRFSPVVCALGGLGAGLNMHFLSNACWGLGQWNVCCGMIFIALGILVSADIRPLWLKAVLAGFSTGMAVMEGFDVGAILSIYVGVFLAFLYLTKEEPPAIRTKNTLLVGGLVVAAAVLISLNTIYSLVLTQIKGTGADRSDNTEQTQREKDTRWQFNTQWSIPKMESLRVIIPGLFGYRMQEFTTSTNKAGSYWGKIAEDPHIQLLQDSNPSVRTNAAAEIGIPPPIQDIFAGNDMTARNGYLASIKSQLQRRHTGNGEYAGILVCLLAAFALAGAGRKNGSAYSAEERRAIWFWTGAAIFSLLAAWGRFGFVYRLIYSLPFLTNIRNPMKYMHPLNVALIILSGYGLEALYRGYISQPAKRAGTFAKWWKSSPFERKWIVGSAVAMLLALVGYFAAQGAKPDIVKYLSENGFAEDLARQIASFCCGEVGLFAVYLIIGCMVLLFVINGTLAGRRAIWAWGLLAAIMICDLYRADVPWVRYYNYQEKLSPNPVVDLLRQKPWEHRVMSRLSPTGGYDLGGTNVNFGGLCHWWLENDYPYNNIESLEIDQAPRMPVLDSSYIGNFMVRSTTDLSPATRLWQLTNTRYIFADAQLEMVLNHIGEPTNSFHTIMRMEMIPKTDYFHVEDAGDLTIQTNRQGTMALIEFTRTLPRAKLFSNWQIVDGMAALPILASRSFDPEKTVLVEKDTPVSATPGQPETDAGTVEITQYAPKNVILQADAKTPAVLLLNDRTSDFWKVWIDDKPQSALRCNYIMQGVFVPAGKHKIEFRYETPHGLLFVSLTACVAAILLGGYAFVGHFTGRSQTSSPAAGPSNRSKAKAA